HDALSDFAVLDDANAAVDAVDERRVSFLDLNFPAVDPRDEATPDRVPAPVELAADLGDRDAAGHGGLDLELGEGLGTGWVGGRIALYDPPVVVLGRRKRLGLG